MSRQVSCHICAEFTEDGARTDILDKEMKEGYNIFNFIAYNVFIETVAGWSSLEARRAHNPKVTGSNPVPAIRKASSVQQRALYLPYGKRIDFIEWIIWHVKENGNSWLRKRRKKRTGQ